MTKTQAIDRVHKLRALAKSTTSANEREVAYHQADQIMTEHSIREVDLRAGGKAAAFDEVVQAFKTYTTANPAVKQADTYSALADVIIGGAKKLSRGKKTVTFDQVVGLVKMAKFVLGDSSKLLNDVSAIVKAVCDEHDL